MSRQSVDVNNPDVDAIWNTQSDWVTKSLLERYETNNEIELNIYNACAFTSRADCCLVLLTAGLVAVAEACSLLLRSARELCCLMQAAADFELSSYTAVVTVT